MSPGEDKILKDAVKGKIYTHSGTQTPNARKIGEKATEQGIITEVMEQYQNDDYALARVRAFDITGRVFEDGSLLHFSSVMQDKIISLYESEKDAKANFLKTHFKKTEEDYIPLYFQDLESPFDLQPDGRLIPNLTLDGQIKIIKDMVTFKKFAVRTAISQARQRAQKQALNQEWRDEEEISMMIEEGLHVGKQKLIENEERQKKKIPQHPETFNEALDKVTEMRKKHKFSWQTDEDIEQSKKQIEKQIQTTKEEKPEKTDEQLVTAEVSNEKPESEKTAVEKALEDNKKRNPEDFKTADQVEKNNDLVDDPDARQFIRELKVNLQEKKKAINSGTIKIEANEMLINKDSGVTMKEVSRVIKQLDRMSPEELKSL